MTDVEGQPVSDATVEFKVYNYAEFYTVATKHTDKAGRASLTAGKGDMLVWASKDGRFGYSKLSFGKDNELKIALDKTPVKPIHSTGYCSSGRRCQPARSDSGATY